MMCTIATYKEAKQRLQRLTVEEFVYTSGCEEPRKKAELTTQSLADKAKKREKKISEIMTVPTLQKKLTTCKSFFIRIVLFFARV